ncbi:hypothetical protein ACFV1U_38710 [Streptomyces microflavus]|uniref:hypothetical protein n=1 Tax=Streptomyces microflavus TaxID=1919 RepID=UPI0036976106
MAVSVMALCAVGQVPAQAGGDAEDGPVSIGVIGDGLKVREVRVLLDGWKPGVRARISEWRGGRYVREICGWKHMTSKETRGYRYEIVTWKVNKSFRHPEPDLRGGLRPHGADTLRHHPALSTTEGPHPLVAVRALPRPLGVSHFDP